MTYHLFLDDERFPGQVTWVSNPFAVYEIVRSYDEFTKHISTWGVPKFVTFDHDLSDEHYEQMLIDCEKQLLFSVKQPIEDHDYGPEKTGYDCAKWLVQYCIDNETKFPEYNVHSMNPVGAERIKQYIEWAKTKFDFL